MIAAALALALQVVECLPLPVETEAVRVIEEDQTIEVWHCEIAGTADPQPDLDFPTI